jgi:outer membrane protein assembly factor BamB
MPATGNEAWRQKLGSPMRAAADRFRRQGFVVTVANEVLALDTADGKQAWKHQGDGRAGHR